MKKFAAILLLLMGIQLFTIEASAVSFDIGIAYCEEEYPAASESCGRMNFTITFGGTDEEETKNAAVALTVYDRALNELDIDLIKTKDETVPGAREGQSGYIRTCSYTGIFPFGEGYSIEAAVKIGNEEASEFNAFDVYPMRRVSGIIRLPAGETAGNPIECRIIFLDGGELTGRKPADPLPTAVTAVIPAGGDSVDYHYDYSREAYRDPVVIDCRISGDSRFTEDNFYTGRASSPYWYQAAEADVSQKDSAGVDFTLAKAKQITGEFTLPEEPEKSGPTLNVTMRAFTDMGTSEKNDDVTVEKKMAFTYGQSNNYTLSVPESPSGYTVGYYLPSHYSSYPYIYDGIPTSGYYCAGGITQLKTYADRIYLQSGCADEINFKPVPYNFGGFSDIDGYWTGCYIYAMTARGIFGAKDSANTFKPYDSATRGECVEAAVKLLGLADPEPVRVFGDVAPDSPYFEAVSAAYRAGLIKGCEDGSFHPDAPVTREDAELILYRGIVEYFKLDPDEIETLPAGDPSSISDRGEISSYASDAVSFCYQYYINMFKDDHRANPQYLMTRCDLASEFYRCLKFLDNNL